jgi:hypothetical protein
MAYYSRGVYDHGQRYIWPGYLTGTQRRSCTNSKASAAVPNTSCTQPALTWYYWFPIKVLIRQLP